MQDWTIEALGPDTYLVHGTEHGDQVDVQVLVDADIVEQAGLTNVPQERIVQATMTFLVEHQRLDELPAEVELLTVAAAYENFVTQLRSRLAGEAD